MHKYMVVNAFGREPFSGNPVAVFFDCDDLSDQSMQLIAQELNLSESTFIRSPRHGGDVNVKIFTPVNELGFAGHPLLGSAVAIARKLEKSNLKIETLKGIFEFTIKVDRESKHFQAYVTMRQPSPVISAFKRNSELLDALALSNSTLPIDLYDMGPRHVFIGLRTTAELSSIKPDYKKLATFENMATLCFSPNGKNQWRMRMFSPAYGVTEDAATGSAAGPLALHLVRHGLISPGEKISIMQGVEMGRASEMHAVARIFHDTPLLEAGGYGFQVAAGEYFI